MRWKNFFIVMMVLWVLQTLVALIMRRLRPIKPRTCPSCGYESVYDLRVVAPAQPGDTPLAYCQCRACKKRYKHKGEGPLVPIGDEEWKRAMGWPF